MKHQNRLVQHVQSRLQCQYDLVIPYQVEQFVSHDATLAQRLAADSAESAGHESRHVDTPVTQESLFINQGDDALEFTLYIDQDVLHSASRKASPETHAAISATDESLDCICTVLEGVSHAVCLIWHAHHDRQIRALDLELQAEVDKFTLLLTACPDESSRDKLHRQLFDNAVFTSPVGSELYQRYKAASDSAATYCSWLAQEFPGPGDQRRLRQELARFYRLSGTGKFDHIKRLH